MKEIHETTQKRTRAAYTAAIKHFLQVVKKNKDVLAVYQIGKIHVPGISDIDLIVIIREKANAKELNSTLKQAIPIKYKYEFLHNPLVVSKEIMGEINDFLPIYNCECLWTRKQAKNTKQKSTNALPVKKQTKAQKTIQLIDMILLYYPRSINALVLKRKMETRHALCILYLLGYNLEVCAKITKKQRKGFKKFRTEINILRKKWSTLGKEKYVRLEALIEKSSLLVHLMIKDMQEYVREAYKIQATKNAEYITHNHTIIFRKDWETKQASKQAETLYKRTKIIASILPSEFKVFLYQKRIMQEKGIPNSIKEAYKKKTECAKKQMLLFDRYGEICASIGIAMPLGRRNNTTRKKIKTAVKKVIHKISLV